jgi:hypothetical protein
LPPSFDHDFANPTQCTIQCLVHETGDRVRGAGSSARRVSVTVGDGAVGGAMGDGAVGVGAVGDGAEGDGAVGDVVVGGSVGTGNLVRGGSVGRGNLVRGGSVMPVSSMTQ